MKILSFRYVGIFRCSLAGQAERFVPFYIVASVFERLLIFLGISFC